jgi:hypothetical protein
MSDSKETGKEDELEEAPAEGEIEVAQHDDDGEASGYAIEQSSPYGETAPTMDGAAKILGEQRIGRVRYQIIAKTFDTKKEAQVYREIEKAVRHLEDVSESDKNDLIESTMKKLPKFRKETGLVLKQAIARILYGETRELGVPVDKLQKCLANSGINLRTKKLKFVVRGNSPAAATAIAGEILVNGHQPRKKPVVEQIACGYYEVMLMPLLDEVLGGGDEEVKITVGDGGAVCSFDGAEISSDGKSALLRLNAKKSCYAVFRTANKTLADPKLGEDEKGRQERKERKILSSYNPSSENHPLTRALAAYASCLAQLQSEFLMAYNELKQGATGEGMSARSLARKAVFTADRRLYRRLPREKRLRAFRLMMPSISSLTQEDRKYVLVSGICVPSEFS